MELIVILTVIVIALVAGIWATRKKPVNGALELMDNVAPPVKPEPAKQPKVVATTGKPKAVKAKPAAKKPTTAKKPAVAAKSTRSRKTTAK